MHRWGNELTVSSAHKCPGPVHRLPRRSLVAGIATLVISARHAFSAVEASASDEPLDYCYWQADDYYRCLPDGTKQREWCYICNDPGTGWAVVTCEWRPDGTC